MKEKREQVSLVLGPDANQRLLRLQERLETSKVGVFKQSLRLLEYLLDLDDAGAKFLVKDSDGTQREIVIFGLTK